MSMEHININIIDSRVFISDRTAFWIVQLYVSNHFTGASGFAYLGSGDVELRFEALPAVVETEKMSGRIIDLSGEDNALRSITNSSGIAMPVLENILKNFLNSCLFCLSPLSDSSDPAGTRRAVSFRYRKKEYQIPGDGNFPRPAAANLQSPRDYR